MTRLLSVLGVVAAAAALVVTAVLASTAPSTPRDVQDLLPAAASVQLPDAGADPAAPSSAGTSTTSHEPDPAWLASTATATGVPARALSLIHI